MVMRSATALATVILCGLLLPGCANSRYVEHPLTAWFTAPDTQALDTPANPAETRCRALAKQRATDVRFEGEDDATQHDVYRRAYDGCMARTARRP